jgi:predicted permease
MRLFDRFRSATRPGSAPTDPAEEIRDEVELYLELRTEELMATGLSPDEARAQAERAFGDRRLHESQAVRFARRRGRRRRWVSGVQGLMQDLRFAVRSLRRRPGFTVTSVGTLALGIGGTAAMFTVIYGVLLRPLPYPEPDRLVQVFETTPRRQTRSSSPANYVDARSAATTFRQLAAYRAVQWNLIGTGEPERLPVGNVSSNFFDALGVPAALGRTFDDRVAMPGDVRMVVLSHGLWSRRFGADPGVVGRTIRLDHETAEVVGVMPPGFGFPAGVTLWMKALRDVPEFNTDFDGDHTAERSAWYFSVIGRLAEGQSLPAAQAEMDAIAARIREIDPESNGQTGYNLVPLHERTVASTRATLWMLFGAVGFVLLVACTNVVNLVLVRAVGRRHELAVRAALGAGARRIVRHVLAECAVLGVLGGTAGLAIGAAAVTALRAAPGLPRAGELGIDGPVLLFLSGVTVSAILLVGALPGILAARQAPGAALGARDGVGDGRRAGRLQSVLVVAEVALAVVLVLGAGLTFRSLAGLARVDLGVRTEGLATLRFALPGAREMEFAEWQDVYHRMLDRVRAVPGVEDAGLSSAAPLSVGWQAGLRVEGREYDSNDPPVVGWSVITQGALVSTGVDVVRGRGFGPGDGPDGEPVAVVNSALAKRIFPDVDPVGQRINTGLDGMGNYVRVVGVAADTRNRGPAQEPAMAYYRPFAQQGAFPGDRVVLTVRAPSDPSGVVRAVQEAVWSVNPDVPFYRIEIEGSIGREFGANLRFVLSLLGAFAVAAALLGAVGIYGVTAYAVRRRTREIGVRLAMGARRTQVAQWVLRRSLVLGAVGVAVGSVAALGLTRLLGGLLYGVSPTDPLTFAVVAGMLLGTAVLASLTPAWRASRVDPAAAVRAE